MLKVARRTNLPLKNIFEERELDERSTTENFLVVRQEDSHQIRRRFVVLNAAVHFVAGLAYVIS